MISAKDARKNAEEGKNTVDDIELLSNHFNQLIRKASNAHKFSLPKQTFPEDRFSAEVINAVVKKLKDEGHKVNITKNNALQQLTFEISW